MWNKVTLLLLKMNRQYRGIVLMVSFMVTFFIIITLYRPYNMFGYSTTIEPVEQLSSTRTTNSVITATTITKTLESSTRINVVTDNFNVLIDIKNFKFLINEEMVCDECKNKFLLIFLVVTAPKNAKKRSVIRQTWGKQSDCFKLLYFTGVSDDASTTLELQKESETYHDIIEGNFIDTYRNLTYKHVMILKWAAYYCQQAKYFVKIDDDMTVDVNVLYDLLKQNYWGDKKLIACAVNRNAVVRRSGKFALSKKEYPEKKFPDYCNGPFLIYSADVVRLLLEQSYKFPFFWIEDVYFTGILAKNVNIKHVSLSYTWEKPLAVGELTIFKKTIFIEEGNEG